MSTALIIAGHGSHLSAATALPAWQHADRIRAMGVFDEVTCAFWKEMPSFHRVIDTLVADDITIVPLFTSQGYFSQTVLPAEFGLEGPITRRDGRLIRYARTVSEHPHITDVVRARADEIISEYKIDPAQTALVLVGHGTKRDPNSALATKTQANILRSEGRFAEVIAVYLEEPPEVETVYQSTASPTMIVIPFFVADGLHTQTDIPRALGLTNTPSGYAVPSEVNGRTVYYTPSIGTAPALTNVILDLAVEAGATLRPERRIDNPWAGFPRAGLAELEKIKFPFYYGHVTVIEQDNRFVVQRTNDLSTSDLVETPSALWQRLSYDAEGNFRALKTAKNLPDGWRVEVRDSESLLAVLETIYPSLWIDVVQYRSGTLPIQTLKQVSERQTGLYRRVIELSGTLSQHLPDIVVVYCGHRCVRNPTWAYRSVRDRLPCPEACQPFMTFALEQIQDLDEQEIS